MVKSSAAKYIFSYGWNVLLREVKPEEMAIKEDFELYCALVLKQNEAIFFPLGSASRGG